MAWSTPANVIPAARRWAIVASMAWRPTRSTAAPRTRSTATNCDDSVSLVLHHAQNDGYPEQMELPTAPRLLDGGRTDSPVDFHIGEGKTRALRNAGSCKESAPANASPGPNGARGSWTDASMGGGAAIQQQPRARRLRTPQDSEPRCLRPYGAPRTIVRARTRVGAASGRRNVHGLVDRREYGAACQPRRAAGERKGDSPWCSSRRRGQRRTRDLTRAAADSDAPSPNAFHGAAAAQRATRTRVS